MTETPAQSAVRFVVRKRWTALCALAAALLASGFAYGRAVDWDLSAVPVDNYMMGRDGLRTLLLAATVGQVIARSDHDLTAYVSSGGVWFAIHIQVTDGETHRITGLLIQPSDPPKASE